MRSNHYMPKKFCVRIWVVSSFLAFYGFAVSGCVNSAMEESTKEQSQRTLAYGMVDVTDVGPNPRQYFSQVRFIDVVNTQSQEQTRILVKKRTGSFTVSLEPGRYEVVRIQISEGPFMAESYMHARFTIVPDAVTYLGVWHVTVDTPRTQRMVMFEISEDDVNWQDIFDEHVNMQGQQVVSSIPDLIEKESRLYAVAPNPKVKYFYRR